MPIIIDGASGTVCIFHVPKCGGIWIEEALTASGVSWRYAELNIPADRRHAVPQMVADDYQISIKIIRPPREWLKSWWRYVHNHATGELEKYVHSAAWHPLSFILNAAKKDMDEFLATVPPVCVHHLYDLYPTDFTGHLTYIADDICNLLNQAGVSFDVDALLSYPPVNQT